MRQARGEVLAHGHRVVVVVVPGVPAVALVVDQRSGEAVAAAGGKKEDQEGVFVMREGKAVFVPVTVGIAGEHLTGAELAAAFSRTLGEDVRYDAVPPAVYRGLGFPGAEDLGNMYQFMHDFNEYFRGARDTALARRLNPALQDFATWLARNKTRIPVTARPA